MSLTGPSMTCESTSTKMIMPESPMIGRREGSSRGRSFPTVVGCGVVSGICLDCMERRLILWQDTGCDGCSFPNMCICRSALVAPS